MPFSLFFLLFSIESGIFTHLSNKLCWFCIYGVSVTRSYKTWRPFSCTRRYLFIKGHSSIAGAFLSIPSWMLILFTFYMLNWNIKLDTVCHFTGFGTCLIWNQYVITWNHLWLHLQPKFLKLLIFHLQSLTCLQ